MLVSRSLHVIVQTLQCYIETSLSRGICLKRQDIRELFCCIGQWHVRTVFN